MKAEECRVRRESAQRRWKRKKQRESESKDDDEAEARTTPAMSEEWRGRSENKAEI